MPSTVYVNFGKEHVCGDHALVWYGRRKYHAAASERFAMP